MIDRTQLSGGRRASSWWGSPLGARPGTAAAGSATGGYGSEELWACGRSSAGGVIGPVAGKVVGRVVAAGRGRSAGGMIRSSVSVAMLGSIVGATGWVAGAADAWATGAGARAIEGYERLIFDDVRSGALADLVGPGHAGDSHAGLFETSVMLAARPALVDVSAAAGLEPMPMDFERDLRTARDFRELGNGLGYTGTPGAASARLGRRLAARYARLFGDLVLDHLAGRDVWPQLSIRPLFPGR